jgi:hypothetical protein
MSEPSKIIIFEVNVVYAISWLQIHLGLAVNWLTCTLTMEGSCSLWGDRREQSHPIVHLQGM